MKKTRTLFLVAAMILGITLAVQAQSVGINSTGSAPNSSAMLDVSATNKGLLIPNVALTGTTDAGTISTPATSLLVYNTATASGITPGYYFNSGTSGSPVWTRLVTTTADGSETKVTAGNNVTVTGTGTTGSPYVISAIPLMTEVQRNAVLRVEGLMIFNTTTNKPNICNGADWMNFDGTSAETLVLGGSYQGGIIAYIYQSGDPCYITGERHGIIAAPSDQATLISWDPDPYADPHTYVATGATATALGTGSANTSTIISVYLSPVVDPAAKVCYDLVLGGYSDWFLPSIDELFKLYLNQALIGGFTTARYWSSSEIDATNARSMNFSDGGEDPYDKIRPWKVRAVRYF